MESETLSGAGRSYTAACGFLGRLYSFVLSLIKPPHPISTLNHLIPLTTSHRAALLLLLLLLLLQQPVRVA